MKNNIFKEIARFALVLALMAFTITPLLAEEQWVRPVQSKSPEYDCYIKNDSLKRKIKLYSVEWVKVAGEKNGDVIIGNDTLRTDDAAVTDPAKKEQLTENRKPLDIKFSAIGQNNDSVKIVIPFTDNSKRALLIDQTKNVIIDTIKDKEYITSKVDSTTVLRVSPENRLSTIQAVAEIEDWGIPNAEPIDTTVDEEKDYNLWFIIVIAIAILSIIANIALAFLLISKKKKTNNKNEEIKGDGINGPKGKGPNGLSEESNGSFKDKYREALTILDKIIKEDNSDKKAEKAKSAESVSNISNLKHLFEDIYVHTANYDSSLKEKIDQIAVLNNAQKKSSDEIDQLKEEISKIKDGHQKETLKLKDENQKKLDKAKKDFDNELESNKVKYESKIRQLNSELNTAKNKVQTIASELEEKFEKERISYSEKIKTLQRSLNTTTKNLNETTDKLNTTENNLKKANAKIDQLEKAQKTFTDVLTYVPFAENYAKDVDELLKISDNIVKGATKLLDLPLDDNYHITKFISKYSKALAQINTNTLVTEVQMATNGKMVLKGSTISTYDPAVMKDTEIKDAVKLYFFDNYLGKLINALVVFNESMAGTDRLVDGVKASDVEIFIKNRDKLNSVAEKLGITIETVHLFDKVGNKLDLRATMIDAGFKPGDILDIENAIVYLKGSRRPETKILVKAQE